MTLPVLLCDGCHQPVATVYGILGYDEAVKESAKDAFRYKLGLFNTVPFEKGTSSTAVITSQTDGGQERRESTRRRRRSQDESASRCPSRGGIRQEGEEEEEGESSDLESDEKEEGFWAYSALNPSKQRFDLLRVHPFLTLSDNDGHVSATKDEKVSGDYAIKASPFHFSGDYSPEHTFFVGYQWQQCSCNVCGKFLGWGFAKEPWAAPSSPHDPSVPPEAQSDMVRTIPSSTPPVFVGLILRMCTSRDDYPLGSLEKLVASSLRRQQQCHALREFSRKWLELLRERPTDLLVHSLVRAYQQRRQEFLKIISDSDGEGMWIGQDHPRPAPLSLSPTTHEIVGSENVADRNPHADVVPQSSAQADMLESSESNNAGSSENNQVVLRNGNSVVISETSASIPQGGVTNTNNTDTSHSNTNNDDGNVRPPDNQDSHPDATSPVSVPSPLPHPLQPPFIPASTPQAQRGAEEEEWNEILSFLPSCFAGLLAAARTLPLIQEPVIGVYENNSSVQRTTLDPLPSPMEVNGISVEIVRRTSQSHSSIPSSGPLVHNNASSDFQMDPIYDSDDSDGVVMLEEDGEGGILITRQIPSGVQLQSGMRSEEEEEEEEEEVELYELMEASTTSQEGWSTESEGILYDSS